MHFRQIAANYSAIVERHETRAGTARCRSWVIRVVSAMSAVSPLYPQEPTSSVRPAMSENLHMSGSEAAIASRCAFLPVLHKQKPFMVRPFDQFITSKRQGMETRLVQAAYCWSAVIVPGFVHVVDDDASFRTAMERRLKKAGYEVATYPSAQHLLDRSPNESELG